MAAEPHFAIGGPHGGGAPHGTPLRLGTRSRLGGGRPAEHRFTVGGSGKFVARCHRTVLAYWKFESISLQQRVVQNHRFPDRFARQALFYFVGKTSFIGASSMPRAFAPC